MFFPHLLLFFSFFSLFLLMDALCFHVTPFAWCFLAHVYVFVCVCRACDAMFILRASGKMGKNGKSYYTHSPSANTWENFKRKSRHFIECTTVLFIHTYLYLCVVYLQVSSILLISTRFYVYRLLAFFILFALTLFLVLRQAKYSILVSCAFATHCYFCCWFVSFHFDCQTKTYSNDFKRKKNNFFYFLLLLQYRLGGDFSNRK